MKIWKKMLLPALIAAAMAAAGAAAYLADDIGRTSSIRLGNNEISIVEDFSPPKKMVEGENIYKKEIAIRNTGSLPCFIRVFAQFSDSGIRDISELYNGREWIPAGSYAESLPGGWTYIGFGEDEELGGYYYYMDELDGGDTCESLFEKVKTTFRTAEEVKDYNLIVYAESIQTRDASGNLFDGKEPWKKAWTEYLTRK